MRGTSDSPSALTRALQEAHRGDREAFCQLCAGATLSRLLIVIGQALPARLHAKIDAEDVLQEVLDQAWRNLPSLNQVSLPGFYRWVCAIARHRVCDAVRSLDNQKRAARREEAFDRAADESVFRYDRTASDSIVRREHVARVIEALDELEPVQREVIVRRILEGFSRQEVAQMLTQTPDWVSVNLHRALARLREILRRRGMATAILQTS